MALFELFVFVDIDIGWNMRTPLENWQNLPPPSSNEWQNLGAHLKASTPSNDFSEQSLKCSKKKPTLILVILYCIVLITTNTRIPPNDISAILRSLNHTTFRNVCNKKYLISTISKLSKYLIPETYHTNLLPIIYK